MDLIFRGILSSDHPFNLKRCLIENRLIPAASSDSISPDDCRRLFATCWDVIAHNDSPFEQEMALKVWQTWSSNKKQEFEAFLPSISLSLSTGHIKNCLRCLEAVCHGLELFSGSNSGVSNSSSSPGAYEHLSSLAEHLIRALAESNNIELEELASATDLLLFLDEDKDETGLTCNFSRPGIVVCALLNRLASTPFCQGHDSQSFYSSTTRIGAFLREMFRMYPTCATEAVAFICRLLADPCGTGFYSTLAPVIEVIDVRLGKAVLKVLQQGNNLGGSSHPQGPQLILAISRLINMLYWPLASNCLPQWVALALRSLGPLRQTPLFIALLNTKIVEIFEMLFIPASCHAATAVFCDILLSYQPAHESFDKIVKKLPSLAEKMKEDNEDWSTLSTSFMLFFKVNQDYLRLYGYFCIPFLELHINQDLFCQLEEQYVTRGQRAAMAHLDTVHPPTAGLDNIGNTCYINSVLQALFSSVQFRNLVLKSKPHQDSHTPVQDLRELFALLSLTKRPSVNPSAYMPNLRPAYFLQGEQQDCQEYMHYLLNQLPPLEKRGGHFSSKDGTEAGSFSPPTPAYYPFGVTTQTSLVCQACHNKTVQKEERNLDLMLHFQKGALTSDLSRDVAIMASPYDVPGPPTSTSTLLDNEASTSSDPPPVEPLPMLTYEGQIKGGGTVNEYFPQKMIMAPEGAVVGQRSDEKDELDDLLKAIHEGEIIDYFCDNCRKGVKALRRTDVVELPSHLILTVLRHSHTNHRPAKILRRICFPEILTFPPMSQPSALYSLYALIVHQGPHMHCGHYFTYAKSSCFHGFTNHSSTPPDTWYLFNDCTVTCTTFKEFSSRDDTRQNIYQLFYRKLDEDEENDLSALQTLDFPIRQKITDDNEQYIQSLENNSSQKAVVPVTKKSDSHGPSPGGGCGEGFGSSDIFSSRCIF